MTDRSLEEHDGLIAVLERARTVGFLGAGPLRVQVAHAAGFTAALPEDCTRLADLGSGGGLPALPILLARPDLEAVLVEAMGKRGTFLVWALAQLGLSDRVSVIRERAEVVAHDLAHRNRFDAVTARAFGPPATTAECAAGLLRPGGDLVVSEPPEQRERWPPAPLAELGFGPAVEVGRMVRLRFERLPPPWVPRPTHQLVKRPRF